MNVIILAGGKSKRLWPLTYKTPKCLLPVAGKPILYFLLDKICHLPGIGKIIIAIDENKESNFKLHAEKMEAAAQPHEIKIVPHKLTSSHEPKGPLKKISEILKYAEDIGIVGENFLVIGADNVFGFNFERFLRRCKRQEGCYIAIHEREVDHNEIDFGIPKIDKTGRLIAFSEKPGHIQTSTACYWYNESVLTRIPKYLSSRRKDNLGSFIGWLLEKNITNVQPYIFSEPWYDAGTRKGLLGANAFLLQDNEDRKGYSGGRGEVGLNNPIRIHPTCQITNSSIGPVVYLASDVKVTNSKLVNSIVLDGAKIVNCRLTNCIVGSDAIVEGDVSDATIGNHANLSIGCSKA